MTSRYFLPEILEANNQISLSNPSGNDILIAAAQKFVVLDTLIKTDNYTVGERTFDLTSFPSTIVHLRHSLNGNPVNSFSPSGLDVFYLVDSADTSYNPSNDIGAAIADDGGVLTDETTEANEATANDMTLLPATPAVNDAYYFGNGSSFTRLSLNISTALNAAGGSITLVWEYYNGAAYVALPTNTLVDGTNQLSTSGLNDVTFPRPNDWAKTTVGVSGEAEAFYIRIRVSAHTPTLTTIPIGQQAFIGTAEAHFESISDDTFLGRIVTAGGGSITSIDSIVNQSKLVVQIGIFENTLTRNNLTDNDITNNTQTINQGEAGAGVGGGSGQAGWIIDRGSLTNFELKFDDALDMLVAGLAGSLTTIPRFTNTSPADGRVVFTSQTLGDEIAVDVLYWDSANNRLGVGVATPLDSLSVLGSGRFTSGLMTSTDSGHLRFNVDDAGNRISTGYASKFESRDVAPGGFRLRTAATAGIGTAVSWQFAIEANATGEIGIQRIPVVGNSLTVGGNVRFDSSIPILRVNDTTQSAGFEIIIENGVSGTDPMFTLRADHLSRDIMIVRQNDTTLFDSSAFQVINSNAAGDVSLDVANTGASGRAVIRIDSSNGDFAGNDYAEIYSTGDGANDLVIATLISAGDIRISPKLSGVSSTGSVGIGNSDMTIQQTLDVQGKIQSKASSFPSFVLQDTGTAKIWHMYQSGSIFHIGQNDTSAGNRAISIFSATLEVSFGNNFRWDPITNRLGINQNVPLHTLHIESSALSTIFAKGIGVDGEIKIDNNVAGNDAKLVLSNNGIDQWEINANGGTNSLDIFNSVLGGGTIAISIDDLTNDVSFDGNLLWDVSANQLILGIPITAADPTIQGKLRIDGNATLGGIDGGIEFKTSGDGAGDGARIFVNEVSSNIMDVVIAHRLNSAAWTGSFTIRRDISGTPDVTILNILDVPISDAGLATGDVWSNSNVLTIVP